MKLSDILKDVQICVYMNDITLSVNQPALTTAYFCISKLEDDLMAHIQLVYV